MKLTTGVALLQKLELESVKRERRTLMDSLASLKADQGKAGSELQMQDIARLRREVEAKQEKLNELSQVFTLYPTTFATSSHAVVLVPTLFEVLTPAQSTCRPPLQ